MQTELTQFSNWLTCQYPHSSARKHTMSDLALFFSWAEKPPTETSPHDADGYVQHCLSKRLSPLTTLALAPSASVVSNDKTLIA